MITKKGAILFADSLAKDLNNTLRKIEKTGIEDVNLIAVYLPESFNKYL